jgi:hypothetical protein
MGATGVCHLLSRPGLVLGAVGPLHCGRSKAWHRKNTEH